MKKDVINHILLKLRAMAEKEEGQMSDYLLKVPLKLYRSDEHAKREREVLLTSPQVLAHCDQLRNPHDYMVRVVMGTSVLLTRDENGKVHAFLNMCRHRGHEPAQGCGNRRRFTCPYHSWTYDSRGQLVGMPLRNHYDGVDFSTLGLTELPSEERHGFIWAVLTPDAGLDVAAHLGPEADEDFRGWGYEDMRCIAVREGVIEANWKATGEGFLEGLHLPTVHASSFLSMVSDRYDIEMHDKLGKHLRFVGISKKLRDYLTIDPARVDDIVNMEHPGWQMRFLEWGSLNHWIFPNLYLGDHPQMGGLSFTQYFPGPTPDTTVIRFHYMVRGEVADDPDNAEFLEGFSKVAVSAIFDEDGKALSSCGRGMRSGVEDITIGPNESIVQQYWQQLADDFGYRLTKLKINAD